MHSAAHILLVEDDPNLGFVVKEGLEDRGYKVDWAANGQEGWQLYCQNQYALCLLDIMMPLKDGLSLAQDIRHKDPQTPLLFVTAKGLKEDKLEGFKAGGDDYITKPFSMEELDLRIQVFLRRSGVNAQVQTNQACQNIGTYSFDYGNRALTAATGQTRTLTQKEADVLHWLCRYANQVVERTELLNRVWGDDDYFMGRSLDVFISRLRKYLKEDPQISIVNLHAIGFTLKMPSA